MYNYNYNYNNELYHYGVLGMKWGVRREQKRREKYNKWLNKGYKKIDRKYDKKVDSAKKNYEISKKLGDTKSTKDTLADYREIVRQKVVAQKKLSDIDYKTYQKGKSISNRLSAAHIIGGIPLNLIVSAYTFKDKNNIDAYTKYSSFGQKELSDYNLKKR